MGFLCLQITNFVSKATLVESPILNIFSWLAVPKQPVGPKLITFRFAFRLQTDMTNNVDPREVGALPLVVAGGKKWPLLIALFTLFLFCFSLSFSLLKFLYGIF